MRTCTIIKVVNIQKPFLLQCLKSGEKIRACGQTKREDQELKKSKAALVEEKESQEPTMQRENAFFASYMRYTSFHKT